MQNINVASAVMSMTLPRGIQALALNPVQLLKTCQTTGYARFVAPQRTNSNLLTK